jgi:hypothetical protein
MLSDVDILAYAAAHGAILDRDIELTDAMMRRAQDLPTLEEAAAEIEACCFVLMHGEAGDA